MSNYSEITRRLKELDYEKDDAKAISEMADMFDILNNETYDESVESMIDMGYTRESAINTIDEIDSILS